MKCHGQTAAKIKRVLFLLPALLAPALLLSNYSSDYYRVRLGYSPHFFYYQRAYMMALARERKAVKAEQYLTQYGQHNIERRKQLVHLLRGIFLAYSGHPEQAKKSWRRFWPHAFRHFHYLVREYRTFKMKNERLLFLRTLSSKEPDNLRLLKTLLYEEIQAGNIGKAVDIISRMHRINKRSIQGIGRVIGVYATDRSDRNQWTAALARHRKTLGPVLFQVHIQWSEYRKAALLLSSLYRDRLLSPSETAVLARSLAGAGKTNLYHSILGKIPFRQLPLTDRLLLAKSLEKDNPDRALSLYRSLGNRDEALRGTARIQLRRNMLVPALDALRNISNTKPDDILLRAKILTLLKRIRKAIVILKGLKEPARGIHTAIALFINGSSGKEVRLPLLSGLRTIPGDGSSLPGLELLYRLQFYQLSKQQKTLAAEALRLRWTEQPGPAGDRLEKLAAGLQGKQAARILIEAARLAENAGAYGTAEKRLLTVINKGKILQDRALYRLALLYRDRQGRKKQARALLMRLVANHPRSLYIYESRRALSEWK